MANIMDLLMDWKNVTRKNEDISKLYILYQTFLMVCSILTPGTIFLMILGAITMAFPAIPPFAAMTINIIPVIGMVMLCFVAKTNVQVMYEHCDAEGKSNTVWRKNSIHFTLAKFL